MPLVMLLISVQLSTKIAPESLTLSVCAIIGYAVSYAPYLSATIYQNHPKSPTLLVLAAVYQTIVPKSL